MGSNSRMTWGGTALIPTRQQEAEFRAGTRAFLIEASADGLTWGNPQAVITAIRSHLQDGSLAAITSYDNREGLVRIRVTAKTYDGLDEGGKALAAEQRVPGYSTLTWTPHETLAVPTVFDVVYATLAWEFDDAAEAKVGARVLRRQFVASFELLPFGRDVLRTTVQATTGIVATPVVVSVDDGSSAATWTATNGSAPAAAGGSVSTTTVGAPAPAGSQFSRTGLNSFMGAGNTAYLFVDWAADGGHPFSDSAMSMNYADTGSRYVTPTSAPPGAGAIGGPAAGFNRSWFLSNYAGNLTSVQFYLANMLPGEVMRLDKLSLVYVSGGTSNEGVLDDGTSTAGWTVSNATGFTSTGGVLTATASGARLDRAAYLNRAGAIDVTTTRFIDITWAQGAQTSGADLFLLDATGTRYPAALVINATTPSGASRSYYRVPDALTTSATSLAFGFPSIAHGSVMSIDQVSRTNTVPGSGTGRQQPRSLQVGGSARARVTLAIAANAGKTLGDLTMLYTRTATTGLQPALRPYRISSSSVAGDATILSGAFNALGSPMTFLIPANKLREAAHNLVARLRAVVAGTYDLTWTAALATAGNADLPETAQAISGTTAVTFAAADTWQTNQLGLLQLPTVPVATDSTHVIRLTLVASNATVGIDEAWLFDLDNGILSWVDTTGLTRLEVRTADLTNPEPSYWASTTDGGPATGLVRADWRVKSFGSHLFEPGTVDVFLVTSGTEGAACWVFYYRSWLHSAAA